MMNRNAPHLLRQLDELEETLESRSGYTGPTRWMIPYADFMTLLLGFFIVMFAVVQQDKPTHTVQPAPKVSERVEAKAEPGKQADATPETNLLMREQTATPDASELAATLAESLGQESAPLQVSEDGRGLVISFQERLFFGPGEATLSPGAAHTLDKLARVLRDTRQQIRVEGHTDNTPIQTARFPSNWELSTTRAINIVKYLAASHHFPPQRLSAAGYGEFYPLADNSTIEGKRKNRRVDIVLLKPLPMTHLQSSAQTGDVLKE